MALSDLQVYNDFAYSALTEVLAQNVELFNGATNGALRLSVEAHGGDFADDVFYGRVAGLVRRRNPYGDGTIAEKVLNQKVDTAVKIGAGTPPVRMDEAWFNWIGRDPEEAGAALGQQLAKDILADKVNAAVGAVTAALTNTTVAASQMNDITGNAGAAALPSPLALSNTAGKMGDAMNAIACWIMHSKSMTDLYGNAISNNEQLFVYGNVAVTQDPFGRRYVMADVPGLMEPAVTGTGAHPAYFHTLGLVPGAVEVMMQNDYKQNISETNGNENIHKTFQAEWSYMLSVKGFAWDKTNGGKAPNDAALNTSTNWDQVVTSLKDGPGVILKSQ